MNVRCEKFRECVRNSLQGFADLILEPPGIRLHDCTFNQGSDGSEWVGLPSRQYEDHKGETKYARLVDFATRTAYYQFQTAAKDAIRQFRGSTTPAADPVTTNQHGVEISDEGIPF